MTRRVFVSSTFEDLKEFREAVQKYIRRLGAVDISMENFGARDERPKEECLRLINEESDFFVGIYAHRYGYVPEGEGVSITEAEYHAAVAAKVTTLVYLVDEKTPWVLTHVDEGQARDRLRKFKEKLNAEHVRAVFSTPEGLAAQVAADLGRELSKKGVEAADAGRRSSLPPQLYFVGRERELEIIADALAPDSRSWGVLIDGPGGIGKTALAVNAAHLAPAENFPVKIFLSAKVRELTPAGEQKFEDFMLPNFIALITELAAELGEQGIERTPPNDRANIVRRALTGKQALIVIDNVETFVEQERVRLYQFLGRLPGACKAIVTSRRRTGIDARVIRLDRLAINEALKLIAKLSESNRHLARATEKERQDLYEITGGNPLLIKWVAGQLGRPGSNCHTIAQACDFIEAAPKGNDPLEYIFGDLLDTFTESETAVLAALAHFTLPAKVEWIAELSRLSHTAAQTALDDLADRALLVGDETARTFLLPPLAGTFLRRKRPEAVAQTGDRLVDRVYALAIENGYRNYECFPKLEAEWPTIAAALPLFLQDDNDLLQQLCNAVNEFLLFSGQWDEGLSFDQRAEERALTANDYYSAGARSYNQGFIYQLRGQVDQVKACADRCEAHFQKSGAGLREKSVTSYLRGLGYIAAKNYPAAIASIHEALTLDRSLTPESEDVVIGLITLAEAERYSCDYSAAERNYRDALRIAKRLKYQEGVAHCIANQAELALIRENWPNAEALAREALGLSEALGRIDLIGLVCQRLAKSLARQGRPHEGLPYARRAVSIYSKLRVTELEESPAVLKECEEKV
ncbi:MAG TPA: DUF4062 domain-containing protein [Pyrinomonadaceae bacterium]|nr:DUF4062 domain-containing protein [Pyrinomonadaceae bacterium]